MQADKRYGHLCDMADMESSMKTFNDHGKSHVPNQPIAIFEGYADGEPIIKLLRHVAAGTVLYAASQDHPMPHITPWEDRESTYESQVFSQIERMEAEIYELRTAQLVSRQEQPGSGDCKKCSGINGHHDYSCALSQPKQEAHAHLPPLPEPGHWYCEGEPVLTGGYTDDQMREYAHLASRQSEFEWLTKAAAALQAQNNALEKELASHQEQPAYDWDLLDQTQENLRKAWAWARIKELEATQPVPDDYAIVPYQVSQFMVAAFINECQVMQEEWTGGMDGIRDIWLAMIAAAQQKEPT